MAKTDLTKTIMARFDRLKTGRQNWETHWQEVADYMQPRKADVTRTNGMTNCFSFLYRPGATNCQIWYKMIGIPKMIPPKIAVFK